MVPSTALKDDAASIDFVQAFTIIPLYIINFKQQTLNSGYYSVKLITSNEIDHSKCDGGCHDNMQQKSAGRSVSSAVDVVKNLYLYRNGVQPS